MDNIIELYPAHDEQEAAIKIERTEAFYGIARELSDHLYALPLTQPQNDRLVALMIRQVETAEQGAFHHGIRIGAEFARSRPGTKIAGRTSPLPLTHNPVILGICLRK